MNRRDEEYLRNRVRQLEAELEEATAIARHAERALGNAAVREEDFEEIYDLIEDHRRGLLSTEELYERTVGR